MLAELPAAPIAAGLTLGELGAWRRCSRASRSVAPTFWDQLVRVRGNIPTSPEDDTQPDYVHRLHRGPYQSAVEQVAALMLVLRTLASTAELRHLVLEGNANDRVLNRFPFRDVLVFVAPVGRALRSLHVCSCPVTDIGLQFLAASCPLLQRLGLPFHTGITAEGMKATVSMAQLNSLSFKGLLCLNNLQFTHFVDNGPLVLCNSTY